ncbi:MAG: CHRD domain-containing protein [Armatimonadota bacterium]|nr:CHRD domain-containing protein [bacterium]MDW8321709.1 CHRD domain-containing protein [Armatimonadota bacterium]
MSKLGLRFALLSVLLAGLALPSHAALWYLQATLTGSQVVPPSNTSASGVLFGSYDDVAKTITLAISITGINQSNVISSQVHFGAFGQNGQAIIQVGGASSYAQVGNQLLRVLVNAPFPVAYESALLSGNTYYDIHTTQYPVPLAELRGQIYALPVVPEPATMAGLGIGVGLLALRRRRK